MTLFGKTIQHRCLLTFVMLGAAMFSAGAAEDRSTVSDELKQFLKKADYVIVCEKKGMRLIVVESLLGNMEEGETFAHFADDIHPPFAISPKETWKDVVIWLPTLDRLAYYRVDDGVFEWFDARNKENRAVKLDDLRTYLKNK